MTQVIGNLLNNACKFTDKGGKVWLTVEADGAQAVIRVRDNGVGSRRSIITKLFDDVRPNRHALERSHGGLGIGLTLVKTLVEMHGGTVDVQSDGPGTGSEFVVRLPVSTAGTAWRRRRWRSRRGAARRRVRSSTTTKTARSRWRCCWSSAATKRYKAHDGSAAMERSTAPARRRVLDIGLPGDEWL